LRETIISANLEQTIHSLTDALDYTATLQHLQSRALVLKAIQNTGISALDVPPTELAARLVNHYLEIKRNQVL
jgi:hypothetical protein